MNKSVVAAMAACSVALAAGAAQASTIVNHEDPNSSFSTFRGADYAPVGLLTVSSSQTIEGFGVDVNLNGDQTLDFLIFNSGTGELLYSSGPTAFTDTGTGYKYSDAFSFTFDVGTTYGLTANAAIGGAYFVDETPNTVGAFSFQSLNQNTTGHTLVTDTNCCDVGTSLVVSNGVGGVPEPATWTMMIGGFGLVGAALRRRRGVAATA